VTLSCISGVIGFGVAVQLAQRRADDRIEFAKRGDGLAGSLGCDRRRRVGLSEDWLIFSASVKLVEPVFSKSGRDVWCG